MSRDAFLAAWREIELNPSLSRFELNPVIAYVRELEAEVGRLRAENEKVRESYRQAFHAAAAAMEGNDPAE